MATKTTEAPSKEGNNLIRILAVILLVLIIIILSLRSCSTDEGPAVVLEPDYATIEVEENAVPLAPAEGEEKPEVVQGGGSVTISFQDGVTYNTATKEITLFYQNPWSSTHDVVVQVILVNGENEYLLGQSGLLKAGYEVNRISGETLSVQLNPGGYTGKLKLLFYDPETGERAIVDTDIPTTITVE